MMATSLCLPPSYYFHQSLNFCWQNEWTLYYEMYSQGNTFFSNIRSKNHLEFFMSLASFISNSSLMHLQWITKWLHYAFCNITTSLLSSFRTLKEYIMYLCFTCGLCFLLHVPVCIHVLLCMSTCVYMCVCIHTYICTHTHIFCLQCISQYYVNVWRLCTHMECVCEYACIYVCPCVPVGLPHRVKRLCFLFFRSQSVCPVLPVVT